MDMLLLTEGIMAGSRQHFIPRFLQKGFASKVQKQEYYAWVFTKDESPYEANLRNIGLENAFYGKPEESKIDDILTEREDVYSKYVNKLREYDSTRPLEGKMPSEFVTHLMVRAKHIRESFCEVGDVLIDSAKKKLDSPEKIKQMLLNLVVNHPELIEQSLREAIDKEFSQEMFPQDKRDEFVQIAMSTIIPQMLPGLEAEGYELFSQVFAKMEDEMPAVAKEGQIKALSKSVAPEKIVEKLDGLHWSLNVIAKHTFILGDIGPIARYEPGLHFKPFFFAKGELSQIFLPISDKHIIVGKSSKDSQIPALNEINEVSASLSQYYFISSSNRENEKKLSNMISSKSSIISVDENTEIEETLNRGFFGKSNN